MNVAEEDLDAEAVDDDSLRRALMALDDYLSPTPDAMGMREHYTRLLKIARDRKWPGATLH
jgi:hypothetical protein